MTTPIVRLTAADALQATTLLATSVSLPGIEIVAHEKLFGPAPQATTLLGAREKGQLVGIAAVSGRWLRVLGVHPAARKRGVGSALLASAEAVAGADGQTRLRTWDQPGNYLAPGLPGQAQETCAWFGRRGFIVAGENENLLVALRGNPRLTPTAVAHAFDRVRDAGYRVERATAVDAETLLPWIAKAWHPAWAHECGLALAGTPATMFVARKAGAPCAFAVHDANNRGLGWFGPAGTLPEHQSQGLGAALLLACLLDLPPALDTGTIAWIGPRAFYETTAGAVSGPRFIVMEKTL